MLALATALAGVAAGAAPESSKRPVGRPGSTAAVFLALTGDGSISPAPRDAATQAIVAASGSGMAASLRPWPRPDSFQKKAIARKRERTRGSVCGDPDLQGEYVGGVPGKLGGCGLQDAVRVSSVAGVRLSQRALIDCTTAKALKTWVNGAARPALRRQGGGLASLRVAAHYSCRTRNNKKGAKISEHGRGRAIDISGFVLRDGSTITVEQGWTARTSSSALRDMHRGACGPFGTVLGPNADSYHRDHFHFDTAPYRSGSYCR